MKKSFFRAPDGGIKMSLYDDDDIGGVEVAKTDEGWSRGVLQMKTKTSALAMQPSSMMSSKPPIVSPKFAAAAALAAKPYISPLAAANAVIKPRPVTTTVLSAPTVPFANNDRFGGGKKRAVCAHFFHT